MEFIINKEQEGLLRDFLRQQLSLSNAEITRLKQRENGITVNGEHKTVRYILKHGDVLFLDINDSGTSENIVPTEMTLTVLFEDEHIIALDKPHGIPTHPSHGHYDDTLANGLMYYFSQKGEKCLFRAVNRLDRETSGIVLCAKNAFAASRLCYDMQKGLFKKTYFAVLSGKIPDMGTIDKNIKRKEESVIFRCVCGKDEGKRAVTLYKKLSEKGDFTLVELSPLTGRTHQLRVHTSHLGAPIVGDTLYGENDGQKLMLHAGKLIFRHPVSGEKMCISSPIPERFKDVYEDF